MISRHILLILVFAFFCRPVISAAENDTASVIDNIFNLDFASARRQLELKTGSESISSETLKLELKWWEAVSSDSGDRFKSFLDYLAGFGHSHRDQLSELICSTYRIRYYACADRNWKIPFLLLKIKQTLETINEEELKRTDLDEYELFTLYKSFFSLIWLNYSPEKFLERSDSQEKIAGSIRQLISDGSPCCRTIGKYFLMKYYLDIKKNRAEAMGFLEDLHRQYPANEIFSQLIIN